MKRTVRLPIFRTFKHPKLEVIGVKDGDATSADLTEMAANTNALISRKLHVPPMRQTHRGTSDGEARGWLTGVTVQGTTLLADLTFTEAARAKVKAGELRWFSAGIRRDFSLTGEPSGPKLPGLYVDHVALLGDEHPQVKGLVDLSTVELSEADALAHDHIYFSVNESGEAACFAEGEIKDEPEPPGHPAIKENGMTIEEQLAEEKRKREAAELALKTEQDRNEKAKRAGDFSEHVRKVKAIVAEAVKGKKAGAYLAKVLTQIGIATFAQTAATVLAADFSETLATESVTIDGRSPLAIFEDVIKNLPLAVPTTRLSEEDPAAEGNGLVTAADFAEMGSDPKKAEKVEAAFFAAKAKDKNLAFKDYRAQILAQ